MIIWIISTSEDDIYSAHRDEASAVERKLELLRNFHKDFHQHQAEGSYKSGEQMFLDELEDFASGEGYLVDIRSCELEP